MEIVKRYTVMDGKTCYGERSELLPKAGYR